MSKISLDLSKFKHISTKNGMTTLRHRDGHELTIAHNSLSPEFQKQLASLSKIPQQAATPLEVDQLKHRGMADGGKVRTPEENRKHYGIISEGEKNPEHKAAGEAEVHKNSERMKHRSHDVKTESEEQDFHRRGKTSGELAQTKTIKFAEGGEVENPKLEESQKTPEPKPIEHEGITTGPDVKKTADDYSESTFHKAAAMMNQFADGGNVKEQKKKVFGSQSSPSNPEMREKHIEHIKNFAKKLFGLEVVPSGGKIDPETGQRRDKYVRPGEDKPDWRSGKLEAQMNPDAIIHELSHLMLLPKGVGLQAGQKLMDQQYVDVQKQHGYMKQKRSQHEVQPMAVENILRRHLGLPAATQSVPVKEGEGPRTSVEDPDTVIGTRITKGNGKQVDLIRQSRFLSPENKERVERILAGELKFHPERGWLENLEHMGSRVKALKEKTPPEELMADGGQVKKENPLNKNIHKEKAHTDYKDFTKQADNLHEHKIRRRSEEEEREIRQQFEREQQQQKKQSHQYADGGEVDSGFFSNLKKMFAGSFGEAKEPSQAERDADTRKIPETPLRPQTEAPPSHFEDGGEVQPPESISEAPRGDLPAPTDVPTGMIPDTPNKAHMTPEQTGHLLGGPMPQGTDYNDYYQKTYNQDLKAGLSEQQARFHALKTAESIKNVDTASSQRLDQQSINDFNKTVQERQRMKALGVPDAQLPPLPVLTPQQQQSMQAQVPQAVSNEQAMLAPAKETQQQRPSDDMGMQTQEGMMQKGLQQQLAGVQRGAEAQGQLGQQQAAVHDQRAIDEKQAADHYQNTYNDLMQERQNFIDDIRQGYVQPEKYWDTHSKIATGIGMILAGFNPTNNPNAAINFLKFQMEQNLNAQRENLGAKQNLLRANLAQFGEARAATEMTRLMQNDIVAHQLESAAGKAASPLAKAAALQAAGRLRMEAAPMFQQFAMRRAMMNLANQGGSPGAIDQMLGYMRVVNPDMAKEMESRYVPGIGMAKIPVPEGARNGITAFGNVDRLINEAINLSQKPYTALSPSERMRGQTLMGELQSQIRTAEDQGVYKESEAQFMNKLIGDNPAGMLANFRTAPKLHEMQQLKRNEMKAKFNQYGLPQPHFQPTQQEQQTVTGKDGREYSKQVINGKTYFVPVQR